MNNETCKWDVHFYDGFFNYETGCSEMFETYGANEYAFKHCPFCGKIIEKKES